MSERVLRQAERLLRANPALLHMFLNRLGITDLSPILVVDDSSGVEEEPLWQGPPEDWQELVVSRLARGQPAPEAWRWNLRLVTEQLASGYREDDPMTPYMESMRVLSERGWR